MRRAASGPTRRSLTVAHRNLVELMAETESRLQPGAEQQDRIRALELLSTLACSAAHTGYALGMDTSAVRG